MNTSTLRFFQTNLHSGAVNSTETHRALSTYHTQSSRTTTTSSPPTPPSTIFFPVERHQTTLGCLRVLTRAVPAPLAELQHLRIVAFEVTAWALICIVALSSRKPSAGAGLTPTLSDFGVMVGIGSL